MPIVQYLEVMKSDDGVQKLTDLIVCCSLGPQNR